VAPLHRRGETRAFRRWAGLWLDGWVLSDYTIPTTGDYYLQVGVVNWSDELYDSGLALDGVSIGGVPIGQRLPRPLPSQ
jgi:hypothetical protein